MAKQLSLEQIFVVLQEAASLGNIRQVCQRYGIPERTFYRWRAKFGGQLSPAPPLEAILVRENEELKQLVAELTLEIRRLRENMANRASA